MIKVKVFSFVVSNWTSHGFEKDCFNENYKDYKQAIYTAEQIEKVINDFAKTAHIISINVSTIDEHYHNNGRGNTIVLFYTVLYNDVF